MQTKVLYVLFLGATTSAALIPPLIGKGILDAGSALLNGGSSSSDSSSQEDSDSSSQGMNIPQLLLNPFGDLVNLGLNSPQLAKKVMDDAQQWLGDTLGSKPATSSSRAPSSTSRAPSSSKAPSSSSKAPSSTSKAPSSSSKAPSSTSKAPSSSSKAPSSSSKAPSSSSKAPSSNSSSPSNSTKPQNGRQRRSANDSLASFNIQANISGEMNPDILRNLSAILSKVNFTKLAKSMPKIPSLQDVPMLPDIPGLKEGIRTARKAIARALDGISDFQTAIQNSVERAINSFDPNAALNNIINTIMRISTLVAKSLPLAIAGASVIQDGIQTSAIIVNTIVNAAGIASRIFFPLG